MKFIRRILRVLLAFLASILLFLGICWLQPLQPVVSFIPDEHYSFPDTLFQESLNLDRLMLVIGENKQLPEGFELAAAVALSAYPELKDLNIKMVLKDGGIPMQAVFEPLSLLGTKSGRQYIINLNNAEESFFEPILLRSLPFNAQVGILAHELGHVVYYHELNTLQLVKFGLLYVVDSDFRAAHERSTDMMPVYHGLGSQIYQYAWFVRKHPSCEALYQKEKGFVDRFYMTDEELKEAISSKKLAPSL